MMMKMTMTENKGSMIITGIIGVALIILTIIVATHNGTDERYCYHQESLSNPDIAIEQCSIMKIKSKSFDKIQWQKFYDIGAQCFDDYDSLPSCKIYNSAYYSQYNLNAFSEEFVDGVLCMETYVYYYNYTNTSKMQYEEIFVAEWDLDKVDELHKMVKECEGDDRGTK